jgi:hypothetical protein
VDDDARHLVLVRLATADPLDSRANVEQPRNLIWAQSTGLSSFLKFCLELYEASHRDVLPEKRALSLPSSHVFALLDEGDHLLLVREVIVG